MSAGAASGGGLIGLRRPGRGVKFAGLPAAGKLALRYASMDVGTISVAVNDQPARQVNVHSSGALTGSFLHAIVDLAIPAQATLTISRAADDVAVVGAFAWAPGSRDAALVATLDPGIDTVIVRGRNNGTGLSLGEVYEEP